MGLDDDLIVAVMAKPVLYDVTKEEYRDRLKKDIAWRRISEEVGLSVESCKKAVEESQGHLHEGEEKGERKRSGSAAGSAKKWRFTGVMSFLDRFISPRETSGNMARRVEEVQASEDRQEDQEEEEAAAAGLSEIGVYNQPIHTFICVVIICVSVTDTLYEDLQSPDVPAAAASSSEQAGPSAAPTGPQRKRARKRPLEKEVSLERELLQALRDKEAPPRAQTDDEHFLLSLLPLLQKVPAQSKDFVKFQIHKLLYEIQPTH
ncbi:hypothetical protein WMY93_009998 [Mugilogobius chulae]|uniref:BESS domain-containing protein n=1 Tax=Mugilogobius chulae TaxID=88201 RepID=A0AAW0PGI8_9GOBI